MNSKHTPQKLIILGVFFCVFLAGCSLGPKALKGNRFDYNVSVQRSNNEELLTNIVRAKYYEQLFFLQVGSISSSFSYTANAGLAATVFDKGSDLWADYLNPSLGAAYGERPTITYTPIQGKEALKQLMEEFTLDRFLLLTRIGWGMEALMWTVVDTIGELHNYEPGIATGEAELYGKFLDLIEIFGRMQVRGDIEFVGFDKEGKGTMQLRYTGPEEAEKVEELLQINPEKIDLPDGRIISVIKLTPVRDLTFGLKKKGGNDTITIKFKSCFGILYDLARNVEVPEEEIERGIARKSTISADTIINREGLHRGLVRVRYSETRPKDAYVSVFYRGRWYYIPDSDARSK
ncbi:MAG: hypothetical protein JXR85_07315, partial [Deltaproteobacteria bacterium]|nr:hypothetical protein [Deltaproteobacteria bacterium]